MLLCSRVTFTFPILDVLKSHALLKRYEYKVDGQMELAETIYSELIGIR